MENRKWKMENGKLGFGKWISNYILSGQETTSISGIMILTQETI